MNSPVLLHVTKRFDGLRPSQPSLFWQDNCSVFEEGTSFLNDQYCMSGARSSPRTWKNAAHALGFWINWCQASGIDWKLASRDDLISFRDSLKSAISPHTQNPYSSATIAVRVEVVIAFCDYGRRKRFYFGDILGDRMASLLSGGAPNELPHESSSSIVPPRRPAKTAIRPFRVDELQALLERLGPTPADREPHDRRPCRNRIMADWGWAVGLRLSEIVNLECYQFHALHPEPASPFLSKAVEVIGKGSIRRNVAVPNWLIGDTLAYIDGERQDAIRACEGARWHPPNVVFLSGVHAQRPGLPLSTRRFQAIIEQACLQAGLSRLRSRIDPDGNVRTRVAVANHCVHDLRHTYAVFTYWVEAKNGNSEPWKIIQSQLGHAHLETTIRTYLRFVELFGPRGQHDIRTLAGLTRTND